MYVYTWRLRRRRRRRRASGCSLIFMGFYYFGSFFFFFFSFSSYTYLRARTHIYNIILVLLSDGAVEKFFFFSNNNIKTCRRSDGDDKTIRRSLKKKIQDIRRHGRESGGGYVVLMCAQPRRTIINPINDRCRANFNIHRVFVYTRMWCVCVYEERVRRKTISCAYTHIFIYYYLYGRNSVMLCEAVRVRGKIRVYVHITIIYT